MREHDEVRLRHMIEAVREAVLFAHGRVRADLDFCSPVASVSGQRCRNRRGSRGPDKRIDP